MFFSKLKIKSVKKIHSIRLTKVGTGEFERHHIII